MKLTTIGFAKKSLEEFLALLQEEDVTCLIDTRLNNTSQLAGFAKKKDLKYILEQFLNIKYVHEISLAPTQKILKEFKKGNITWEKYKKEYISLLDKRNINHKIDEIVGAHNTVCFLCSEHKPDQCHRSLLTDYISTYKKNAEIIHLQ